MAQQNIAIIGLGRVGTAFLKKMLALPKDKGINVVYAVEKNDTEGKKLASAARIQMVTIEELINLCSSIDIIFDLTGSSDTRRGLRAKLQYIRNKHTIIAPETVARMMWSLMGGEALPDAHSDTGY